MSTYVTSVRVPITNRFASGGYSAKLFIGAQRQPLNLILDSGSSVLAVLADRYNDKEDRTLRATSLVQHVRYGKGGWRGPVVTTSVRLGLHRFRTQLEGVAIALACEENSGCFADADGILGLAYQSMDHAIDARPLLAAIPDSNNKSYPWLLSQEGRRPHWDNDALMHCPKKPVMPYFSQLEEQGIVADQFAFYTHRSSIYQGENSTHTHLNHGLFVIGKPHIHTDLHTGQEAVAKVVHDRYYNVNVTGIRVGNASRLAVPPLATEHLQNYCSNGIVDSGASYLVLPQTLFEQIRQDLIAFNPTFAPLLASFSCFTGKEQGVDINTLDLAAWPDISLYLQGDTEEEISITLSPDTYWQCHSPDKNQASFKLCWLAGWPNQLILGLPVLNNYFTVFDRSADTTGVVRFIQKRLPDKALLRTLHRLFHPANQRQEHHESV